MVRDTDGIPGWVKVIAAVALALAVVLLVLALVGTHGPGRHAGASERGGELDGDPPARVDAVP